MEMDKIAVSNIVSAIISKNEVIIGADNKDGIHVHIKAAKEMSATYRSTIKLEDLIKLVEDSFAK